MNPASSVKTRSTAKRRRAATKQPLLQTVSRAVALLRCFEGGALDLSLSELTERLGLNKITVYRLAATLEREGLLTIDHDTRRYSISFGILGLAQHLFGGLALQECALSAMTEARDETGETLGLMVREGWEQVVIQVLPSPQPVRYVFEVASRGPIFNGAAGQAILAHLPIEDVQRLVAEAGLAPQTDNSIASTGQLYEKLESIREQGFGVSFGERIPDTAATAAPVFGAGGEVKAALSILMPLSRATDRHIEECAGAAVKAARQVSIELKNYQVS